MELRLVGEELPELGHLELWPEERWERLVLEAVEHHLVQVDAVLPGLEVHREDVARPSLVEGLLVAEVRPWLEVVVRLEDEVRQQELVGEALLGRLASPEQWRDQASPRQLRGRRVEPKVEARSLEPFA